MHHYGAMTSQIKSACITSSVLLCSQAHYKVFDLSDDCRGDGRTLVSMSLCRRSTTSALLGHSYNPVHLVLTVVGTDQQVSRTGEWAGGPLRFEFQSHSPAIGC